MLGHKMTQILRKTYPDTACTILGSTQDEFYRKIDIFSQGPVIPSVNAMDFGSLKKILTKNKPDFVINCIGIIKQRDEAANVLNTIALNTALPHRLADHVKRWGGRVIHFSTDCVFSGKKGGYTEDDPSDAEDLYGKTKFLGETDAANALTLRTSIIGRELSQFKSLLEWFLAQRGKTIRGYKRVYYSGVTTNDLARVVAGLIENHPDLSGLYQVASETISKHDLLVALREAFKLDVDIIPDEDEFSDRSLIGDKFREATGYTCPPWPGTGERTGRGPDPLREVEAVE